MKENPDVTSNSNSPFYSKINWVGMSSVQSQVNFEGKLLPALSDIFVSLDKPEAKGIHMSRLYKIFIDKFEANKLSYKLFDATSKELIESQLGLSNSSKVEVSYQIPVKRKALLSDNYGTRLYKVKNIFENQSGATELKTELVITYSSTCPCSAALAQKLIYDHFQKYVHLSKEQLLEKLIDKKDGLIATPHSQRSEAKVTLVLKNDFEFVNIQSFIDGLEGCLKTPVQTSVKREDEQEFAKLNGTNTMFCEDASRILKEFLEKDKAIKGYSIRVDHFESLHAHNATAIISGGSLS